jgi:hypothetical protein
MMVHFETACDARPTKLTSSNCLLREIQIMKQKTSMAGFRLAQFAVGPAVIDIDTYRTLYLIHKII